MTGPACPRLVAAALLGGALLVAGCSASGSGPASAAPPSSAAAAGGAAPVRCSGSTCSLTLTGDATSGSVLGTRVAFGGVRDGRATLAVGDRTVSCRQGDSVAAGPLRLTCSTVQPDRVTLTAGLGG